MDEALFDFLTTSGWSADDVIPIAGDMSQRRFYRVSEHERSAILMDARSEVGSVAPFEKLSRWLNEIGLSAPEIFASGHGLLLVEDFGDVRLSQRPDGITSADHEEIIALLLRIRFADPPPDLHRPGASEMADWLDVMSSLTGSAETNARVKARIAQHLSDLLSASPATVSLRDFHSENILWLPDRSEQRRYGLIDFQDAFLCHPVYDLVSWLTDARHQVDASTRQAAIRHYAREIGEDIDQITHAFSVISLQRNLRILALFTTDDARGGTRLKRFGPRVLGYIEEALEHPALTSLRSDAVEVLPKVPAA